MRLFPALCAYSVITLPGCASTCRSPASRCSQVPQLSLKTLFPFSCAHMSARRTDSSQFTPLSVCFIYSLLTAILCHFNSVHRLLHLTHPRPVLYSACHHNLDWVVCFSRSGLTVSQSSLSLCDCVGHEPEATLLVLCRRPAGVRIKHVAVSGCMVAAPILVQ